ncbi:hypothetical protein HDU84_002190 [Entophlyctis sp. JEL0112]|nr:hypothetical protein HDU84_002190 [Entophlyctis sp. JEL0112]
MDNLDTALEDLTSRVLITRYTDVIQVASTLDQIDAIQRRLAEAESDSAQRQALVEHTTEVDALQRQCSIFLTNLTSAWIKHPPLIDFESGYDVESLLDRASALLAIFARISGDANRLAPVKEWKITDRVCVKIKEMSFDECAFGWQTWIGGVLFSYLIASGNISVGGETILELGCGTGIVGITASKMGATKVYMTDYMESILSNCNQNVESNECADTATVCFLDWSWIGEASPGASAKANALPHMRDSNAKFDKIFGADICYDPTHGKLVPPVCARFLERSSRARVHLVTGLRGGQFSEDILFFEQQMGCSGFMVVNMQDVSLEDFLAMESGDNARHVALARSIFSNDDIMLRVYEYGWAVCGAGEFEVFFTDTICATDKIRQMETLAKLECLVGNMCLLMNDTDIIDSNHIAVLKSRGRQWISSYTRELRVDADDLNDKDRILSRLENLNHRISNLMPDYIVKKWTFRPRFQVSIRELSFQDASYGWQTWGAGVLMSFLLSEREGIDLAGKSVLELGCGTGIVGISAALFGGAEKVTMTDYLPQILQNAEHNMQLNGCNCAQVQKLDWREIDRLKNFGKFDVIIAADICYELEHATLVPPVCKELLRASQTARIYLMTTVRDGFTHEVEGMQLAMQKTGLNLVSVIELTEETFGQNQVMDGCLREVFHGVDRQYRLSTFCWSC